MLRAASLSLALQGATLGSKSLLLILLAYYLSPVELGRFGLLALTVTLAVHVAGLDFYAFAAREIVTAQAPDTTRMVRDQLTFHGVSYLVLVPLLLAMLLVTEFLPGELITVTVALVVLEHLAQEQHRLLVTLQRPVSGAVLVFLRGGVWVYVAAVLMATIPATRSVRAVCGLWSAGVLISLLAGAVLLRDLPWRGVWRSSVDWSWIRRGLAVSLPLLLASSALRALLALDRYALEFLEGTLAVGIYTFYGSIRNAIQGSLEMAVVFLWRPKIVGAFRNGHYADYQLLLRRLAGWLGLMTVALMVPALLLIRPLVALVGQPVYGEHLVAYFLVLGQAMLLAASELPHTALYARGGDRGIVGSTLLGLVTAAAMIALLVPALGLEGAALATLLGIAVTGAAKLAYVKRESKLCESG